MDARRFTLTLDDGTTVTGPIHGSGGLIAGDRAIDRLARAIAHAAEGRDSGFYEPQPGFCRVYPDYSAVESGTPVDVDMRRVMMFSEAGVEPRVIDATAAEKTLTGRQAALLASLRETDGAYLWGADVRVARKLEAAGLVTIEDNGAMRIHERDDRERWLVTPRPVRVRKMVIFLDYTGLPRAWGAADDIDTARAAANRQLDAYVAKPSTRNEPDLADRAKYTSEVVDVREVVVP